MFVHVVLMQFPDDETAQEAVRRLQTLEERVEVVRDVQVGLNAVPSDQAFDVGLVVTLDAAEDRETYEADPAHQEVAAWIRANRTGTARCDFPAD